MAYFVAFVTWFIFCWALIYFVTFAMVSAYFDEFIKFAFCIIAIDFILVVAHCMYILSS